jgi:hypothetical protein
LKKQLILLIFLKAADAVVVFEGHQHPCQRVPKAAGYFLKILRKTVNTSNFQEPFNLGINGFFRKIVCDGATNFLDPLNQQELTMRIPVALRKIRIISKCFPRSSFKTNILIPGTTCTQLKN